MLFVVSSRRAGRVSNSEMRAEEQFGRKQSRQEE